MLTICLVIGGVGLLPLALHPRTENPDPIWAPLVIFGVITTFLCAVTAVCIILNAIGWGKCLLFFFFASCYFLVPLITDTVEEFEERPDWFQLVAWLFAWAWGFIIVVAFVLISGASAFFEKMVDKQFGDS